MSTTSITPPPIFPSSILSSSTSACPDWTIFAGSPRRNQTSTPGCRWRWPSSTSAPRYFAEIMANLLFWLGAEKRCFGSDYAIWSPKWLIEQFMAFELPEDLKQEYHVDLTFDIKRKILGENTARLYGIDIPAQTAKLSQDGIGLAR